MLYYFRSGGLGKPGPPELFRFTDGPSEQLQILRLEFRTNEEKVMLSKFHIATVVSLALLSPLSAMAQGGGGGGGAGGAGSGAAGSAGSSGSASGSAGTGNTSTGIGQTTGASATNNPNANVNAAVSPNNPATTAPGGPNAQPVPQGTVSEQSRDTFDPRLSPGYQK
jgi:hypothetical protein